MKKILFTLLGAFVLTAPLAQAQCKDCGCKKKCETACECKHDQKPQ